MRWSVSPTRVPDWNWNWTVVRPERYIFLNILVTVRDRLVTQPCHLPATTHYVPTTLPGYVAGHGRAVLSTFRRYTRAIFLLLFLFSFYIYIYTYICPRATHLPHAVREENFTGSEAFRLSFEGKNFNVRFLKILGGDRQRERERERFDRDMVRSRDPDSR